MPEYPQTLLHLGNTFNVSSVAHISYILGSVGIIKSLWEAAIMALLKTALSLPSASIITTSKLENPSKSL